jgi:hypothetical protein
VHLQVESLDLTAKLKGNDVVSLRNRSQLGHAECLIADRLSAAAVGAEIEASNTPSDAPMMGLIGSISVSVALKQFQ